MDRCENAAKYSITGTNGFMKRGRWFYTMFYTILLLDSFLSLSLTLVPNNVRQTVVVCLWFKMTRAFYDQHKKNTVDILNTLV